MKIRDKVEAVIVAEWRRSRLASCSASGRGCPGCAWLKATALNDLVQSGDARRVLREHRRVHGQPLEDE